MNLRLKQTMAGEGGFVKLNKLYYLSVHTLDNAESVRFAKNRVGRELLDLWVDKKISFGGLAFDDTTESLTTSDLRLEWSRQFCRVC